VVGPDHLAAAARGLVPIVAAACAGGLYGGLAPFRGVW
jgi:hypothetical protein